jgi:hypothetical protein
MDGYNPFTPPRAPLRDSRLPAGFAASGWTAAELRVQAALAAAAAFGVLVLLLVHLSPVAVDASWLQLFALALLLLWGYLLWRLRLLVHDRYHLGGLALPLVLQLTCGLLLLGSLALPDVPGAGEVLVQLLQRGGAALGLLWLAERLMRRRGQQPLLTPLAACLLLSGLLLISPLLALAALGLLLACALLAALFLQVARELEAG